MSDGWDAQRYLEELTPGGSEYYQNPKRCFEWASGRIEAAHRIARDAALDRNRLAARLATAEAALRSVLDDLERRDELSALDTLRTALAALDPEQEAVPVRATEGGETTICTRCGDPIADGYMIGDGDGAGRRFAHPECYRQYPGAYKKRER